MNPDVILYPAYGASPTPEERFSRPVSLAEDPNTRLDFATIDRDAVNDADIDRESGSNLPTEFERSSLAGSRDIRHDLGGPRPASISLSRALTRILG